MYEDLDVLEREREKKKKTEKERSQRHGIYSLLGHLLGFSAIRLSKHLPKQIGSVIKLER
jgi:hypothetical protein